MTKPKTIHFEDYPDFKPNLTPYQIFELGSFGGTYWRPIFSSVTKKNHMNRHKKFDWSKKISDDKLTKSWDDYDIKINKYCVKVGTTLEFWESKDWIISQDPYGWCEWYCNFYDGRRSNDDRRQIDRWMKTAGPTSRFRKNLINQIKRKGGVNHWNDYSISPRIRQTLQHWSYQLTMKDLEI